MGVEKLQDQRVKEIPSGYKKEQGNRRKISDVTAVKGLRRGDMHNAGGKDASPTRMDDSVKNVRPRGK